MRYVFAAEEYQAGLGTKILEHIFEDKNADGISYQNLMNNDLSYDEAEEVILGWLK